LGGPRPGVAPMRWRVFVALTPAWAQLKLLPEQPVRRYKHPTNYPQSWNPYLFDLEIALDSSTQPVCGVTDQEICWTTGINAARGYTCEECCLKEVGDSEFFPEGCFPFMDLPEWWEKEALNPDLLFKDFCCKGKLMPNFDQMEQEVIQMSEDKEMRAPSCEKANEAEKIFEKTLEASIITRPDGSMSADPQAAYDEIENVLGSSEPQAYCFDYMEGYNCKACCLNSAKHPISYYDERVTFVEQNPCFQKKKKAIRLLDKITGKMTTFDEIPNPLSDRLPAGSFQDMSPYEIWEECCMQLCAPNMELAVCAVMPYTPYILIGIFIIVIIVCAGVEKCLINNYLCFKPLEDADAIEELEKPERKRFSIMGKKPQE